MENASHALIMAGGIIIAMAITGLLLFAFHNYQSYKKSESDSTMQEQIYEYNKKFESYNKRALKGTELVSLLSLVKDTNKKNTETSQNSGSDVNEYPEIEVYIAFLDNTGADGKYQTNSDGSAKYKNNYSGVEVKQYDGIKHQKWNLDSVTTSDGRINKDVRDLFKLQYFECEEIVYQDKTGYVQSLYFKELYDKYKN